MPCWKKQPATIKNTSNLSIISNIVFYQYMPNSFFIVNLNIEVYDLSFQEMSSTVNQIENIIEKLVNNNKKLH